MSTKQNFSLGPRLLNGVMAAIVGAATVFPLDLVKTRLQNQAIGPHGERQYRSLIDCFMQTVRNEGVRGLYRGLAVNLTWVGPEKGVKLVANDFFRNLLSVEGQRLALWRQGVAGGLAGLIQMMISCPTELLKIQMQDSGRVAVEAAAAGKTVKRITAFGVARKLLAERGVFGLYKGLLATSYRDIIFAVVYFPMYAAMSEAGPKRADGEAKFYWSFVCGLVVGAICAVGVTPFDVVKTRMQAIAKSEGQKTYNSIAHCFVDTFRTGGVRALFHGGACRVIVIAPLYGIAQTVYYLGVAEFLLGIDTQKSVR